MHLIHPDEIIARQEQRATETATRARASDSEVNKTMLARKVLIERRKEEHERAREEAEKEEEQKKRAEQVRWWCCWARDKDFVKMLLCRSSECVDVFSFIHTDCVLGVRAVRAVGGISPFTLLAGCWAAIPHIV